MPRYSLRTLLGVVTLACYIMGYYSVAERAIEERHLAIAAKWFLVLELTLASAFGVYLVAIAIYVRMHPELKDHYKVLAYCSLAFGLMMLIPANLFVFAPIVQTEWIITLFFFQAQGLSFGFIVGGILTVHVFESLREINM